MPLPRLKIRGGEPRRTTDSQWLALERRLDRLPSDWCAGEVLNLPGLKTIKFKETEREVFVLAEPTGEPTDCACGSDTLKRNGLTAPQRMLDLPVRGSKRTSVYFRAQRYICLACRKTSRQCCRARHEHHLMTARLVEYVERASLDIRKNFHAVARETGVAERVVRNINTAHTERLEKNRIIETPRWIAIDEVYPKSGKKARCVVTDPEKRRVVDLLPTINTDTLKLWLLQLPGRERVEVVSMDMCPGFRAAVKQMLPGARVVADRYHVQNLLNTALKETLDVVRESLTAKEREQYMRHEYLLLKSRFKLSTDRPPTARRRGSAASERQAVAHWFNEMPDVARAYTLKEDFASLLQSSDRQRAERLARVWLEQARVFADYVLTRYAKQCKAVGKKPFGSVVKTITGWFEQILNYVEYKNRFRIKVTNAFAEYANREIKRAERMGNGYNFDVLRAKLVYGEFVHEIKRPHPLKRTKKRFFDHFAGNNAPRTTGAKRKSNTVRLREAREGNDKTKDLLPKPQENQAWVRRFVVAENDVCSSETTEPPAQPKLAYQNAAAINEKAVEDGGTQSRASSKTSHSVQLVLFNKDETERNE